MSTQGEKIKQLRQSLNLSQDEFGQIFGIQKQMVSSLEKDKLKLNNEKLELLCDKYNVNINWLLCSKGTMFDEVKENNEDIKALFEKMFEEKMKELK